MAQKTLRLLAALIFFLWGGFVLAAFYVVQKPLLMGVARGLGTTFWMLAIWGLLTFNAWGLGRFLLAKLLYLRTSAAENLFLGAGIGLGVQGLLGYALGLLGWAHPAALFTFQIGLLLVLLWRGGWRAWKDDLQTFAAQWQRGMRSASRWVIFALGTGLALIFILALAPPAEGFDALFYHLPVPLRVLQGDGLQPSGVEHFWFPALPEGAFLWAVGMYAERAAQLLHMTWGLAAALLLWHWAETVWSGKVAQKTLLILLTMPSLYLLASWAYADLALTFFGLAAVYGVWRAAQTESDAPAIGWAILAGAAAGMAMGVKYTSFPIPLVGGLLLLWWGRRPLKNGMRAAAVFSVAAILVAAPWYLRNWLVMGNPFYPFVFGGLYWDDFLSAWYAGSGVDWTLPDLLLLPLSATLGYRDAMFYDGRIGPLYLLFAPMTIYALMAARRGTLMQRRAVLALSVFALLSVAVWLLGMDGSATLWQTRLLYPVLIPFALLTALGWLAAPKLDTPHLRISFIVNFMAAAVIFVTLADTALYALQRNPLKYAAGLETRQAYLSRTIPHYAQAIDLVAQTPEDAQIYSIFEPRSYYFSRNVRIDAILGNLGHDLYLHGSPDAVVRSWKDAGYTHILFYRLGADFLAQNEPRLFPPEHQAAMDAIMRDFLELVGITADGGYELYVIR